MKKTLLSLLALGLSLVGLNAQDKALPNEKITFESSRTTSIRVDATPIDGVVPQIDWGNGELQSGNKNWQGMYAFNGTPSGTITIYGACKELDLSNFGAQNEVTSVAFQGQDKLEKLTLTKNKLKEVDLTGLTALKTLELGENELTLLDLSGLANIEDLKASKNKLVAIILEGNSKLKYIVASHNEMSNFTLSETLPKLRSLDLEDNAVTSLDLSKTPDLRSLTINKNGFSAIDLTLVPSLEKFYANENYFTSIDLSKNTELLSLSMNKNLLKIIDLSHNDKLTSVEVAENQIKEVGVSNIIRLKTLNVGKNEELAFIDLRGKKYLSRFIANDTNIAGLDMTDIDDPNYVDLRGTRFSPVALTQFFKTLNGKFWATYTANILLDRTSYKGADFSILKEKNLKTDIKEDVETGPVVEAKDCKLSLEAGEGGTVKLALLDQELTDLTQALKEGQLIYIDAKPNEGMELASIKAEIKGDNGDLIQLPVMTKGIVMEVDTKIIVTFRKIDTSKVTLTTTMPKGSKVNFTVHLDESSIKDEIFIDWGDGQKQSYTVTKDKESQTVIDGTIAGETITIYGAINTLMAAECSLTQAELGTNPKLTKIDLYGNELTELDLSALTDLDILNVSLNKLKALDLSKNTKIRSAKLYANSDIKTIDLSNNKELVVLDLKNTGLTSVTLDLPKLEELVLHDNKLSNVDLSKLQALRILRLGYNLFETFGQGLSLPQLKSLSVEHCKLTDVDLSGFPLLEWLFIQENPLNKLEIPKNLTLINKIHIEDCGLDVCQLDRFYKSLPVWQESKFGPSAEPVKLYNRGQTDQANKVETSNTGIAIDKGWTVAAQGDATGCPEENPEPEKPEEPTAVDEITLGHGFNFFVEGQTCVLVPSPEYRHETVKVYSIKGEKVFEAKAKSEYRVRLAHGVYIIRIKGTSFKVVI